MSGSSAADEAGTVVVIAPDAACAATARRHVTEVLRAIGRPDLLDAARLAVTELATNAALHARTLVTVNVRVLVDGGVRIEVGDRSTVMPREHPTRPTSTVGRGLHVVESLGRWGVEPLSENGRRVGKVVWFSPTAAAEPRTGAAPRATANGSHGEQAGSPGARSVLGRYLSMDGAAPEVDGAAVVPVTVRLLTFPLRVFLEAREHHDELLRELALLSLQRSSGQAGARPLPPRLAQLIDRLGRRLGAAEERGHEARDTAIDRGDLAADLDYRITPAAVQDLVRLTLLLDDADRFCREGWLLTMPEAEPVTWFRRWYTDEFVRQLSGLPPTPWQGPLTVDDPVYPG